MSIIFNPHIVMHKETGQLAELTKSWFGYIIWLKDFEELPNDMTYLDYVIFDDDKRFKQYEVLGEL